MQREYWAMHLKDTIIIQSWSSKWHASLINTSQNVFIIIACDAFTPTEKRTKKTHKPALSAQMCVYSKTQHIHTSRKAMLCCEIIPRFAGEQKSLPCSAKALRATTWDPHTTMCFINSEWRQTLSCCVCVWEKDWDIYLLSLIYSVETAQILLHSKSEILITWSVC